MYIFLNVGSLFLIDWAWLESQLKAGQKLRYMFLKITGKEKIKEYPALH